MDKEEILRRAKAEGRDEREAQVKDRSMLWSYIVLAGTAAIFAMIRAEQGLPSMDLCATVSLSVFAGMLYRAIKLKKMRDILIAAIAFCAAVLATVRFFMGY